LEGSVGPLPLQAAPDAVAMAIAAAAKMRLAYIGSLPFHASAGARIPPRAWAETFCIYRA
jgi:hypothetical protein